MTLQRQFDKIMDLLGRQADSDINVKKLIDTYKSTELQFTSFDTPSPGTTKNNVLGAYEIRARIEAERNNNMHVIGYEKLLPALREVAYEHICVSGIISGIGTWLIFSDFDRENLIGILYVKPSAERNRREQSTDGNMVESSGDQVKFDYGNDRGIFINGIHLQKGNF